MFSEGECGKGRWCDLAPVFQPRGDVWAGHRGPGQLCEVLGIHSRREGAGCFYIWAGGIFWFLLTAFCGQPELLSDLVPVCHRSYFSARCFPISASSGRTEADVKTQLQMMWNWLLFASPALMLLPPVLFFGKKISFGPSEMILAPKILTTPPSKQQNNPTTTTSTTINYKDTNDAMKSWISLCHLCKASRRNQCGVWLLVFWKPWMCQLILEWLAPAGGIGILCDERSLRLSPISPRVLGGLNWVCS